MPESDRWEPLRSAAMQTRIGNRIAATAGTPPSPEVRDTRAVFGDCIHFWDMEQAKEGGALDGRGRRNRRCRQSRGGAAREAGLPARIATTLRLRQFPGRGAANRILGAKDGKKRFAGTALAMSKAFTLSYTLDEAKSVHRSAHCSGRGAARQAGLS